MLEPLSRVEGEGKWAVPIAVYGNRSAETCVEELAKILRKRRFKILAGAFVGEDSFASKNHHGPLVDPTKVTWSQRRGSVGRS